MEGILISVCIGDLTMEICTADEMADASVPRIGHLNRGRVGN
jgi:hypothetical protein